MDDEKKTKPCPHGDVVTLGPPVGDGVAFIRHRDDHTIEAGVAHPVEEGKPALPDAELVALERVEGNEFRVTGSFQPTTKGPAQVATRTYRERYDAIFGKQPTGQA